MDNAVQEIDRIDLNTFRQISFVLELTRFTGLSEHDVSIMIKYNIITPKQLAMLTKRRIATIENLMRPVRVGNKFVAKLKTVFPFPSDTQGPKFILYDKDCHDYIQSIISNKKVKHGRINRISEKQRK